MTQRVAQLQTRLEQVFDLLENASLLALSFQEDGAALKDQAAGLFEKLAKAEDEPLTIGLLGGTGVGKSTILNALAGSEISAASHRRPWTDHILVYRHEEAKGMPPDQLAGIPWKEFVHQDASIGKILVCDMPDFDSIQAEHRERVLAFVKHLDLLVWVTSPEKYADQQFHDFLVAVPKAQQNFFFVLNKLDLMFDGQSSEKGYEQVTAISQAFHRQLQASGISDPLVFLVSAKDRSETLWNQFPIFKKHVFQERRVKEVMAIKATNLDVEVQSLLRHVGRGMKSLETFETILVETANQLQSQRKGWLEKWEWVIEGWTENHIKATMRGQRPDPMPLLGPGYGLALLMESMKNNMPRAGKATEDLSSLSVPHAMIANFETHLRWLEARMEKELLRHSLRRSFTNLVRRMLQIPERVERLKAALSQSLTWHAGRAPWPSFLGFKIWQGTCYFFALAILLLAVGGETPWKGLLENPGLKNLAHLFLSCIDTLFSTKGLAALGTYVILNLFLGFRFYRRFSKRVDRVVDRQMAALNLELKSAWENQVDAVVDALDEIRKEIALEKSRISAVTESAA